MSFACPIKTSMPYDLPQIPMSKVTEPGTLYIIFYFKIFSTGNKFSYLEWWQKRKATEGPK